MKTFFVLLFTAACGTSAQTISTDSTKPAADCPMTDAGLPPPVGTCNNKFTGTGKYVCAICPKSAGCVDTQSMVYCVTSCADPICTTYSGPHRLEK